MKNALSLLLICITLSVSLNVFACSEIDEACQVDSDCCSGEVCNGMTCESDT